MKTKSFFIYLVFSLLTSSFSAQFAILHDFASTPSGYFPKGSLVFDGTFLYGMTEYGGANNQGSIFKIKPDGTLYSTIYDFNNTNGIYPKGSLFLSNNFLYGMTPSGGNGGNGVIFKIMANGTGFTKLMDFSVSVNGYSPQGSLISDGTYLYGMTSSGGNIGGGVIFKILPNGSNYTKLFDFGSANGSSPYGSLLLYGGNLFGMTWSGGANNFGVAFKIGAAGGGYTKLIDFSGASNGKWPNGALITDGTYLYGNTAYGGIFDNGVVFKIMISGGGYTKLVDFSTGTSGAYPKGSLISDGTFLYGMTSYGGSSSFGTIFKVSPSGTGFLVLKNLNSSTRAAPNGDLLKITNFLYGMTNSYGSNSLGTIFRINPYCSSFTTTNSYTICSGGSITAGTNTYNASGSYTDVLQAVSSCDSTIITNLTVNSVNIGVSVLSPTLVSNASSASYQWINCNTLFSPIIGQTNQNFVPSTSGNYAVIVTQNGCLDTSACYTVNINSNTTGLNEVFAENTVWIFPNPFFLSTTISFSNLQKGTSVKILDMFGKELSAFFVDASQATIERGALSTGLYFLQIVDQKNTISYKKIIIQ